MQVTTSILNQEHTNLQLQTCDSWYWVDASQQIAGVIKLWPCLWSQMQLVSRERHATANAKHSIRNVLPLMNAMDDAVRFLFEDLHFLVTSDALKRSALRSFMNVLSGLRKILAREVVLPFVHGAKAKPSTSPNNRNIKNLFCQRTNKPNYQVQAEDNQHCWTLVSAGKIILNAKPAKFKWCYLR